MTVRVKTWFAHIHAFTCVLGAHAYPRNVRVIAHGGGPIISVWIINLNGRPGRAGAEQTWRERCQANTFGIESQTFFCYTKLWKEILSSGGHPQASSLSVWAQAASRLWVWITFPLFCLETRCKLNLHKCLEYEHFPIPPIATVSVHQSSMNVVLLLDPCDEW